MYMNQQNHMIENQVSILLFVTHYSTIPLMPPKMRLEDIRFSLQLPNKDSKSRNNSFCLRNVITFWMTGNLQNPSWQQHPDRFQVLPLPSPSEFKNWTRVIHYVGRNKKKRYLIVKITFKIIIRKMTAQNK